MCWTLLFDEETQRVQGVELVEHHRERRATMLNGVKHALPLESVEAVREVGVTIGCPLLVERSEEVGHHLGVGAVRCLQSHLDERQRLDRQAADLVAARRGRVARGLGRREGVAAAVASSLTTSILTLPAIQHGQCPQPYAHAQPP